MLRSICIVSNRFRVPVMDRYIRGSLYGSVFGDVCGAPFELKKSTPLNNILEFFRERLSGGKEDVLRYTDDTEMALCICESLKRMNGFNASDLAKTFSDTFDNSPPCRIYGGSIGTLFGRMKADNFSDPILVASRQFNGSGSYGNGGGMRITPAALFGLNLSSDSFNKLVCQVTAVTHTNPLALLGALLQAHAIRRVISISASSGGPCRIDVPRLVNDLYHDLETADLSAFALGRPPNFHLAALQKYSAKLETVKQFFAQRECPSVDDVVAHLGHGEPAIEAIPTALYVFLRCLKPMPDIPYESLMVKCSIYATSIGYDTDTIGCMACAIAGSYLGADKIEKRTEKSTSEIPAEIFKCVEGLDVINGYCDWLIQNVKAEK
ncbi:hypothetical protein Aperf_G00000044669 [Anoplocephala perfoliata]